jgi:hypothetical protein
MTYNIYLKKEIQNEICYYLSNINKKILDVTIDFNKQIATKGSYSIPLSNVLLIEEE